jgi:hypothetical protein
MVSICWLLSAGLLGDPMRVGGSDVMSMSIIMLDRLRRAGSRGNKGREGIGDTRLSDIVDILDSRIAMEGRGKDHERTRSSAKTWHPIKNMSITKKLVGSITNPSCRILAPFAKQNWIRHVRRFHWCPSQLEVSSIVIGKRAMPIQGHHNEVLLFLLLSNWRQQRYLAVGSMIEVWAKYYRYEKKDLYQEDPDSQISSV